RARSDPSLPRARRREAPPRHEPKTDQASTLTTSESGPSGTDATKRRSESPAIGGPPPPPVWRARRASPPGQLVPRGATRRGGPRLGGRHAAAGRGGVPVRVPIVARRNYHLFQPLLYQVATAALSPGDIAYPIRAVVRRQPNTEVYLAEAVSVDVANRRLVLK